MFFRPLKSSMVRLPRPLSLRALTLATGAFLTFVIATKPLPTDGKTDLNAAEPFSNRGATDLEPLCPQRASIQRCRGQQ